MPPPWPATWATSEVTTAEGVLSRPLLASEYRIPVDVELSRDQERLIWSTAGTWRDVNVQRESGKLLDGFVALAAAGTSALSIRDFARRWGGLGICPHGQPATHAPHALEDRPCEPVGKRRKDGNYEVHEPLSAWRSLARRTKAVIEIAASLRNERPAPREEWRQLIGPKEVDAGTFALPRPGLDAQRRTLAAHVSNWLGDAGIRQRLVWHKPGGFWLRPEIDTFFAALSLSVALAVSAADALYRCDYCGSAFIPTPTTPGAAVRRPRRDRRISCTPCRERGEPQRYRNILAREKARATKRAEQSKRTSAKR